MKHFLLSILLLLAASPGWAAPTMQGPSYLGAAQTVTWTFDTTTAASPLFGAKGLCSATFIRAGGETVTLYQTTASTATGGTSIASFSATTTSPTALTIGQPNLYAVSDGATAGGKLTVHCSPLQVSSSGGVDASVAMSGAYMTWGTVEYMASMTRFEGLDSTIPWTDFWIDPYNGSDSNTGTYASPFRTLAKWKTLAGFGTRFTIKNGGRDRPMYISNQTFPYPTDEACEVGEVITYDSGGSTSRILDIDPIAGKFVVKTLTGGTLDASDVITAGSRTGSACAWTVGTRTPSLWDEAVEGGGTGTYLCTVNNTDTCLAANRYTGTNCNAGFCGASIEGSIALSTTPTRYDGRIVSILDVEDPSIPVRINSDNVTPGELDNTELGSNSDRNGLFITGNGATSSYGCLGVANFVVEDMIDDAISQHQEGCTKTLNVTVEGVRNVANAQNNNAITTHNGTSGRGQVVVVGGGGYNMPYVTSQGAAIAPTGASAMTIIGTKPWFTDGSLQNDTSAPTTMLGTGGKITFIGGEVSCRGILHGNGCQGHSLLVSDAVSELNLVRHTARATVNAANAAVSMTTNGFAGTIRGYRNSLDGGRGFFTNAANGAIAIDIKGVIFDDLDNYVYDFTAAANSANLSGSISGVYDNDGSNRWHFLNPGSDYNTAALADAAPVSVAVMSDSNSVQTDATEYTAEGALRCASTGECFDSYTESFTLDFPEVIYDYLPVPIRGYVETGTRSYGAR